MNIKITDTEMTSDVTRHAAAVVPGAVVEGGPTAWSVTWLPGRLLTRTQAITAMALAEVVVMRADDLTDNQHKLWLHIDAWAAELGITGPHAFTEAMLPPEDHQVPRGEWPSAGTLPGSAAQHPSPLIGITGPHAVVEASLSPEEHGAEPRADQSAPRADDPEDLLQGVAPATAGLARLIAADHDQVTETAGRLDRLQDDLLKLTALVTLIDEYVNLFSDMGERITGLETGLAALTGAPGTETDLLYRTLTGAVEQLLEAEAGTGTGGCPAWCEFGGVHLPPSDDVHQAMADIPYASAVLNAPDEPPGPAQPYCVDLYQAGDQDPHILLTSPNHDDGTRTTRLTIGEAEEVARAILAMARAARKGHPVMLAREGRELPQREQSDN